MTVYLGDLDPSAVIDFKFTTVATTGAPTTLAGSPAVSVYKDNGTTESVAGVTLTVDFDSRAGMHHVRITTATDGTFYAAGSEFAVVITAGTVGGTSVVGYVLAHFSIYKRSPLRPATAGRTALIAAGGHIGVDWGAVANPTTAVGLTNTTVGIVTLLNGIANNVITAASIAANAITSAKVAAGAIASGVIAAAELLNIADALLKRDMSAVTGEAARSPLNAFRFMRNRWAVAAGTLTVYKEDDSTSAWTSAVVTSAGNPVTSSDPA